MLNHALDGVVLTDCSLPFYSFINQLSVCLSVCHAGCLSVSLCTPAYAAMRQLCQQFDVDFHHYTVKLTVYRKTITTLVYILALNSQVPLSFPRFCLVLALLHWSV